VDLTATFFSKPLTSRTLQAGFLTNKKIHSPYKSLMSDR
jgi:hypothetical protein